MQKHRDEKITADFAWLRRQVTLGQMKTDRGFKGRKGRHGLILFLGCCDFQTLLLHLTVGVKPFKLTLKHACDHAIPEIPVCFKEPAHLGMSFLMQDTNTTKCVSGRLGGGEALDVDFFFYLMVP